MFTVQQIQQAHSKVQSGSDFPAYIRDLKELGVHSYELLVADGHVQYFGADDYQVSSAAKYAPLIISPEPDEMAFRADLKAHQQGKTDYPTFCSDSARSGVSKWVVSIGEMTCTYYDSAGRMMLLERIQSITNEQLRINSYELRTL